MHIYLITGQVPSSDSREGTKRNNSGDGHRCQNSLKTDLAETTEIKNPKSA